MKKTIYILAFTFLGILLQFVIHGVVEIWYIRLLLADFPKYGFGLTWAQWYLIHHILSVALFAAGLVFGFWQGRYWWQQIYVLKRWRRT